MTAPPVMRPRRNGGCSSESLSRFWVRPAVSTTMIEKIMVVAPTTAVPMSTGLAVALNVLAADLRGHVRDRLDDGQLVDGLGVVGDGPVGVDGDGDGAHPEEAEGDEAERADGGRHHQRG